MRELLLLIYFTSPFHSENKVENFCDGYCQHIAPPLPLMTHIVLHVMMRVTAQI